MSKIGNSIEKAREFQKNTYFCFIDGVDHNELWRILKEKGVRDHLTCLLRDLYVVQEATVRTGHGTTDSLKIGKELQQGCVLSPCLFNFYAEYIMQNTRLDELQTEINISGRNTNNLRYELCYWRRLLRVPWMARRSNQSILKETSPEYSLGLMLKLKFQYFGHLMRRTDSLKKPPDAGKDWRQEEKGPTEDERVGWHHWLDGHDFEQTPGVGDRQGGLVCSVHGVAKSRTWLSDWTELIIPSQ